MKGTTTKKAEEPVGIVISGTQGESETTVFLAYVWGPAPASPRGEPKAA